MLFSRRMKVRYIGPALGGVIVKAKSGEVSLVAALPCLMELMVPGECYALTTAYGMLDSFKEMPNAQFPY